MAKKSKEFALMLNEQRDVQIEQQGMKSLKKKVKQGALGKTITSLVTNPKGEVKMSEVLEDFVSPYLDDLNSHTQREMFFQIAVAIWNLSLLPEDQQSKLLDEIVEKAIPKRDIRGTKDLRGLLEELLARKQQYFRAYKRMIVDFNLQDAGSKFHLSVASTLANQPDAQA